MLVVNSNTALYTAANRHHYLAADVSEHLWQKCDILPILHMCKRLSAKSCFAITTAVGSCTDQCLGTDQCSLNLKLWWWI